MKTLTVGFQPLILSLILAGLLINSTPSQGQEVTSPEDFFGFQMGADRKLARWDKIVEYFNLVEGQSDRIKVYNMGPSAEGHKFLIVLVTSAENLANLDHLQMVNKKISNPKGLNRDEIRKFIAEGKAVIFQSMSLHASEVGGTQMTPELTHDLLSRNDAETKRILDNVLFFMIPSLNPDGQVMITDWYNETVGTEYEGLSMPYLYHKYTGHDNNRDGDYLNLQESKYTAKAMFVDWPPQAYIDHHHMGSYGARFYVPPYCDPIRPYADPLVWREIGWYGSHIAYKLEEKGFQGVLNAAQFAGWGHFGWHWITPFHNIAGMLTESASVNLATPIYIHPEQLRASTRAFPHYEAQSTFPNPWPGGWWRLRDIVEQKKSSAWSLLDLAARNKETVLETAYLKAKNQTERGGTGDVKTLVVPADQHDYTTMLKMINTLLRSGIEIERADAEFMVGSTKYKKGSYVISLAQPKMGLIRNLLTETHYADNDWTRADDGSPIRPYDLATHTMNEFMGVQVDAKEVKVEGGFSVVSFPEKIDVKVEKGAYGYVLDGRENNTFMAVSLLIDKGVNVKRLDEKLQDQQPGDFVIEKGSALLIEKIANETGIDFMPLNAKPNVEIHNVNRGRLGLFQRYHGGNMDEGWTRLCFENFSIPYESLMSTEVRKGDLNKKYDVIVIPDDSRAGITGIYPKNARRVPEKYPAKYDSGVGKDGGKHFKEFVKNGGTLVAFGNSFQYVVEEFGLKVRNVATGIPSKEFFCPGSTVKVNFDHTHPAAYGMPDEGLVMFRYSPAFEIVPSRTNAEYETVVRYKDENLLKSGWLIGEDRIAGKSGMIVKKYGKGKVVLIGFRVQHRNQMDGTFKLLFNNIIE